MSDLAGKVRVPYKNNPALKAALKREFERNPYVARFFRAASGWGKRKRKVAVALTHHLAGGRNIKRPDLTVAIEAAFSTYQTVSIPDLITEMGDTDLLEIKRGRGVSIPTV